VYDTEKMMFTGLNSLEIGLNGRLLW